MRILLTTADRWAGVTGRCLQLLARHWPDAPPVDVLYRKTRPDGPAARSFSCALPYAASVAHYLREHNGDGLVCLLLGDYGACAPVRPGLASGAEAAFARRPRLGQMLLCWYPTATPDPDPDGLVNVTERLVKLMPAVWRREFLLAALDAWPEASPWSFESAASHVASRDGWGRARWPLPDPEPPVNWLAIDRAPKVAWPFPFHNLYQRGEPDPRHADFVRLLA